MTIIKAMRVSNTKLYNYISTDKNIIVEVISSCVRHCVEADRWFETSEINFSHSLWPRSLVGFLFLHLDQQPSRSSFGIAQIQSYVWRPLMCRFFYLHRHRVATVSLMNSKSQTCYGIFDSVSFALVIM